MIDVVYGQNRFLVMEKVDELIEKEIKNNGEVERFDFDVSDSTFDFGKVIEAVMTVSLFSLHRIVFVNFENEKDLQKLDEKELLKWLDTGVDAAVILTFPKKFLAKNPLSKALKKHANEHSIATHKDTVGSLTKRLETSLKHYQITMTFEAKQLFLERIGEDYARMDSELKKLALLETTIDVLEIEQMVTQDISRDVFALGNALLDKDVKKAFRIYHSLLMQKYEPLNLAPLVAASLRSIYQVGMLQSLNYSNDAIMNMLQMSKGQLWYLTKQKRYDAPFKILEALDQLATLDQKAKLGEVDPYIAFESFMIEIMI